MKGSEKIDSKKYYVVRVNPRNQQNLIVVAVFDDERDARSESSHLTQEDVRESLKPFDYDLFLTLSGGEILQAPFKSVSFELL